MRRSRDPHDASDGLSHARGDVTTLQLRRVISYIDHGTRSMDAFHTLHIRQRHACAMFDGVFVSDRVMLQSQ